MLKVASDEADLAIIDAPPFAKDIAFEAAQHADFILIPTKPAVLDVMSMVKTLELVITRQAGGGLLTFCPVQGREVADMEASIRKLGATVALCGCITVSPIQGPADWSHRAGVRTGRQGRG